MRLSWSQRTVTRRLVFGVLAGRLGSVNWPGRSMCTTARLAELKLFQQADGEG